MNIGFDAKRFFHNRTGLGHYSRSLVKLLAENYPENQYHLYTPKAVGSHEKEAKAFRAHIHTNKSSYPSFVWRTFGISKYLKRDKIDVFHGLSNELPLNLDKYNIPGIVTIHDLLYKRYPEYYKATDRFIYDQKTKLACKNAERIIAISEVTKSDIMSHYHIHDDQIVVVPPVSLFEIQSQPNGVISRNANTKPYLLCVSGFEKRKNIERLIEAYGRSSKEWELLITGKKGDTASECIRLVDKLNLQQKVKLHFNPDDNEIKSYYRNAGAFIYPSLFEGFGIPVLDALCFNLPILTSKGTSMEEIAEDAALYFSALDVDSITDAINSIFSETIRQKLVALIPLRQESFTPEKVAHQLIQNYQSIL